MKATGRLTVPRSALAQRSALFSVLSSLDRVANSAGVWTGVAPVFEEPPRVGQTAEDAFVRAYVAEPPVAALDEADLHGLFRRDEAPFDARSDAQVSMALEVSQSRRLARPRRAMVRLDRRRCRSCGAAVAGRRPGPVHAPRAAAGCADGDSRTACARRRGSSGGRATRHLEATPRCIGTSSARSRPARSRGAANSLFR